MHINHERTNLDVWEDRDLHYPPGSTTVIREVM